MIPRAIESRLQLLLAEFPAVALLGPRQVGKTTLALALAKTLGQGALYLDLERASDRAKIGDPELYLALHENQLVIFDEIHRAPGLFETLRSEIDQRRRDGRANGHFLLLGSASIDLMRQPSETLAGRIAYEELAPLSVSEVGAFDAGAALRLWLRGGFPDSYLAKSDATSLRWRQAFIQTYLERDVPVLGPRIPADTLHRLWQMLAHNQGQLLNAAQLAGALSVSGATVSRYLDIMVDLLLIRRLQPWSGHSLKRLVRTPKTYVRDSGLLHALLDIEDQEQLLGHPVAGWSWEGMIIENIINALAPNVQTSFYRTSAGAEIDVVLAFRDQRWAIEIKRSISAPAPRRGFYLGCEDIQATRQIVLYPGTDSFKLNAQTEVMPLATFLADPHFPHQ